MHAGRHRSKSVDRYAQGEINVVINIAPDGLARSHYLAHGPSVAALGLWVGDAVRAVARAEALLAARHEQPVGPGELRIPAIRGVGGSLVHFLDHRTELARVREVEFEPAGGAANGARTNGARTNGARTNGARTNGGGAAAGLTRIDHIAQTIPFEELPSWRLFYAAVLGFDRTPQVDVADPAGLVESQVLFSPGRAVQVVRCRWC